MPSGQCTGLVVWRPSSKGSKLGLYTRCPPLPLPGQCTSSSNTSWQSSSWNHRQDRDRCNGACVGENHNEIVIDERRLQPEAVWAHCVLFEEITLVIVSQGSRHGGGMAENGSPYWLHTWVSGCFHCKMRLHNQYMQQRWLILKGLIQVEELNCHLLPPSLHKCVDHSSPNSFPHLVTV